MKDLDTVDAAAVDRAKELARYYAAGKPLVMNYRTFVDLLSLAFRDGVEWRDDHPAVPPSPRPEE